MVSALTNVKKIIRILRKTKAKQIYKQYYDGKGGMCANAAITTGFGMRDQYGKVNDDPSDAIDYLLAMSSMTVLTGINETDLFIWNDQDKLTFKQIATKIEKKIKKRKE